MLFLGTQRYEHDSWLLIAAVGLGTHTDYNTFMEKQQV